MTFIIIKLNLQIMHALLKYIQGAKYAPNGLNSSDYSPSLFHPTKHRSFNFN